MLSHLLISSHCENNCLFVTPLCRSWLSVYQLTIQGWQAIWQLTPNNVIRLTDELSLPFLTVFFLHSLSEIRDREVVSTQRWVCTMSIDPLRPLIQRNSWCWKTSSPRQDPQLFTQTYISEKIFQILSSEILYETCLWKKLIFSATSSLQADWHLNLCLWAVFPIANF